EKVVKWRYCKLPVISTEQQGLKLRPELCLCRPVQLPVISTEQQGLKHTLSATGASNFPSSSHIHRTTRIETQSHDVNKQNRQLPVISTEQQGLKHIFWRNVIHNKILPVISTEQKGLKLDFGRIYKSSLFLQSYPQNNKD